MGRIVQNLFQRILINIFAAESAKFGAFKKKLLNNNNKSLK